MKAFSTAVVMGAVISVGAWFVLTNLDSSTSEKYSVSQNVRLGS